MVREAIRPSCWDHFPIPSLPVSVPGICVCGRECVCEDVSEGMCVCKSIGENVCKCVYVCKCVCVRMFVYEGTCVREGENVYEETCVRECV